MDVSDYMVRDLVCAQLWQPISLVPQRMLTNSFTYLPVQDAKGQWCLVSDLEVAKIYKWTLKEADQQCMRNERAKPLEKARRSRTSGETCHPDNANR